MKLFSGKPDYVRLDDDVSFQIVRTNPKLTTNTKLMYDGENLYMEAYPAAPILSTLDYKHHRVWKTGLFNRDLRNFLMGTDSTAYTVGQSVRDTILLDSFDNQFENMYWCGVESIDSDVYPQEMGCIAPLYLRKKKPNYFVIFKIDTPANTNLVDDADTRYDFRSDILRRAKIVKTFDLREGTPIGNYIKRYVEQKNFEYDKSIYVNFSSNEIYYYGIDKGSGVLTQKVENIEEQMLHNDNTIMKGDDWITSGFERNNLIFPYIINFEFLFDDNDIEEYKFARYFGMYCNDIDLYDLDVTDMTDADYYRKNRTTAITTEWGEEDNIEMSEDCFYYIKDKYNNIFSITNGYVPGHFNSPSKLNLKDFTGFELTSVSTYAEKLPGAGHSIMILEVYGAVANGDIVKLTNAIYNEDIDDYTTSVIATFYATNELGYGEFYDNRFSTNGTKADVAKALAGAIRTCNLNEFKWVTAFSSGNKVIIKAMYPGANLNKVFDIKLDDLAAQKIRKLTDKFDGGTDLEGCMFKVYTSDKNMFFDEISEVTDRDYSRYLRCGIGRNNSKVVSFVPYVDENKNVDDTYSVVITDKYGPYVNVSNTDEVEIIDRFYPKVGILSFFPVKDFDFDTVSSAYGEYAMMQQELDLIDPDIEVGDENEETISLKVKNIPYGRFFYHNGDVIGNEYEYFFENIVPELSVVNKTVPYIAKWGYIDDAKDSCENVYRLNTSKIFEACNFSANTFMKNGDILEYTHSMPYYINNKYGQYGEDERETDTSNLNNEYQYIHVPYELWRPSEREDNYSETLDTWVNYFLSNSQGNPFDKLFGDTSTSQFTNKRFNKKYSRFLLGNDVNKSSTLFRGVKFEITELDNDKEVHTGKFNNYKFSFIYVPVWGITDNKYTVHFIKNDTYKFIVGLVLFDMKNNLNTCEFNKAYVYAGSMGYIELDEN